MAKKPVLRPMSAPKQIVDVLKTEPSTQQVVTIVKVQIEGLAEIAAALIKLIDVTKQASQLREKENGREKETSSSEENTSCCNQEKEPSKKTSGSKVKKDGLLVTTKKTTQPVEEVQGQEVETIPEPTATKAPSPAVVYEDLSAAEFDVFDFG